MKFLKDNYAKVSADSEADDGHNVYKLNVYHV